MSGRCSNQKPGQATQRLRDSSGTILHRQQAEATLGWCVDARSAWRPSAI